MLGFFVIRLGDLPLGHVEVRDAGRFGGHRVVLLPVLLRRMHGVGRPLWRQCPMVFGFGSRRWFALGGCSFRWGGNRTERDQQGQRGQWSSRGNRHENSLSGQCPQGMFMWLACLCASQQRSGGLTDPQHLFAVGFEFFGTDAADALQIDQ